MRRQQQPTPMRHFFTLLFVAVVATRAMAAELPAGRWWKRPEIVQSLQLTEDQQRRLEVTFRKAAPELIDLRGDIEKQSLALRAELDQSVLNRQNIQRAAARLSEARGRLFERELAMLIDMRAVLSETQWTQLRAKLDRPANNLGRNQRQNSRKKPLSAWENRRRARPDVALDPFSVRR